MLAVGGDETGGAAARERMLFFQQDRMPTVRRGDLRLLEHGPYAVDKGGDTCVCI
jgi:hypothetical protein